MVGTYTWPHAEAHVIASVTSYIINFATAQRTCTYALSLLPMTAASICPFFYFLSFFKKKYILCVY